MRYMLGFPIAWVVVYFMFSFITMSFSPSDWSENYRIYENMFSIDEIHTVDGTNIINLVRDRVIERLENILQRESNEI